MIAFAPAPNPDPYAGNVAILGDALQSMSPEQIALSVSPENPRNVYILPYRKYGYSLDELYAQNTDFIILLPDTESEHFDPQQKVVVLHREELVHFFNEEISRINTRLSNDEAAYPEIRIASGPANAAAYSPQMGAIDAAGPTQETLIFNDQILVESKLVLAGISRHEIGHILDYRVPDEHDMLPSRLSQLLDDYASDPDNQLVADRLLDGLREKRLDELEADDYVIRLASDEPRILQAMAQFFLKDEAPADLPESLWTHPSSVERASRLVPQTQDTLEWNQAGIDAFIASRTTADMLYGGEAEIQAPPSHAAVQPGYSRQR